MYSLAYSVENAHEERIYSCSWGYANEIVNDKNVIEKYRFYTPEKECIVTASSNDTLKVWFVGDQSLNLRNECRGKSLGLVAMAVDDRCTICASVSIDSKLVYWDLKSGTKIKEINRSTLDMWSIAFAPDDKHVVTSGQSGRINMLSVPEGAIKRKYDTNGKFALSIAISPDGKHVACGRFDGITNIFDAETTRLTNTLEGHVMPVRALCFSPDSEHLVTGADDGYIIVYYIEFSEIAGSVSGHLSGVLSLSYSENGQYFVSSGSDRCVKIWTVNDFKCVQVLTEHRTQVWCAKFNRDGTKLASVSEDRQINIYTLNRKER